MGAEMAEVKAFQITQQSLWVKPIEVLDIDQVLALSDLPRDWAVHNGPTKDNMKLIANEAEEIAKLYRYELISVSVITGKPCLFFFRQKD